MAITSLVLGVLGLPTLGCLGVGALLSIVLGILALTKANREPEVYGGKGLAIGGIVASALSLLVAIPMAGIIAAIAIPSLLRARVSANESQAIGDVRTVISAEAAYQSVNNGYYGPIECLPKPGECIAGYSGPNFLDPAKPLTGAKGGYRRTFYPGPAASQGAGGTPPPPGGIESFAFVAVPEKQGATGVRSFCGDSSGRVCAVTSGSIDATGGECPPPVSCGDL
jgi:type II secretory pathway pseudopilin PulG